MLWKKYTRHFKRVLSWHLNVYDVLSFLCVDVEAFAKAMEGSDTKTDNDGDSKDKKDDDEDMSLD